LPFLGFSVTIPHKESIVPWVDDLFAEAADLRIVNTIKREHTHYQGFNTDAPGCASALEEITPLKNQRCLILGAGGSAKAIAYILLGKNAVVTLCNRTLARASSFTEKFGGKAIDFNTLFASAEFPYDIIINTLPAAAFAQQCAAWKIPPTDTGIAMDIVLKPLETAFIQAAKAAGWRCITGDALFAAQALGQLKIWFNSDMPPAVLQLLSQVKQL
jgi:shikimate dehydrogenase